MLPSCAYSQSKLKVGLILSLSGTWEEYGEAQKNAIELARKDFSRQLSNVEFIYEDCQYGGKSAASAFNKLRTVDNVDIMFVWGVEPSQAVAPLAKRYKIPLFASTVDPNTSKDNDYVIRTFNNIEDYSRKFMEYARTKNYKNIGLVQVELSYFDLLRDALIKFSTKDQKVEVLESVIAGDTGLRTIATKLTKENYDIFGLYLTHGQTLKFYRLMEALKIDIPVFGASPFMSETLIRDAGGRMEGSIFTHNYVTPEFKKRYKDAYKSDFQIPWAANAYDFVHIVADLYGNLEVKPSAEEIIQKVVTSVKKRNGVGGGYTLIDSKEYGRYFEYPIIVYKIENGTYLPEFR